MVAKKPVPPGFGKDHGFDAGEELLESEVRGPHDLTVGLFPYVPMPSWYTEAVFVAWQRLHPGATLTFSDYDCYRANPPDTLDVFAFDEILAAYFAQQGFLLPFDGGRLDDFFPWTLSGLTAAAGQMWGLPYLGCTNVLIYHADDHALAKPGLTVDRLQKILGISPDRQPQPPQGEGLLVDFTGGTTIACLYLQITMENADLFPQNPGLPHCPDELDPLTMQNLWTVVAVAGRKQAAYHDIDGYTRMNWFLNGFGRAYVGLTESLHHVPAERLAEFAFRPLPFASTPVGTIPLYADAVGINSKIDRDRLPAAVELVQLIAGRDVALSALTRTDSPTKEPQYLIPARISVLKQLAGKFPTYATIKSILDGGATAPFRLGPDSRPWIDTTKRCLVHQVLGPDLIEIDERDLAPNYQQTPAGLWRRP